MRLILASTSKTRQQLLRSAGVSFAVTAPDVDEAALKAQNSRWQVADVAIQLARAKAADVSSASPGALVIGADQTLISNGRSYDKPGGRAEARRQLLELRGHDHQLHSAVCCARNGQPVWEHSDTATLTMRDFSETFLDTYLDEIGNDCTASVGAYKLESRGIQLFSKIEGNYHTILGLPLLPLLAFLRAEGELPA